ncbi:MAG: type IX secretion system outer membrane channel protein PorV [Ignavibacteriae bacterium]|nr:MAG: type IX secretion system outer membrane channel protein PorV [Ignavibacteriota bacterium]
MTKFKLCVIIFFALVSTKIFAQGESAVPFLLIGPNSGNTGMGETGTGLVNDASAMFWNPAGLAFQKGTEVSITHSPWLPGLGLGDLFYDYLSGKHYVKKINGTIGISITYLNIGTIIQTNEFGETTGEYKAFDGAFAVGYGTKVTKDLGVGVVTRFIYSKLAGGQRVGNEKGTGVAYDLSFDVSALWKPTKTKFKFINDRLGIGLNLSNIGPKVTYVDDDQADPLPTNLRLGFAYDVVKTEFNNLTVTADFSKLIVRRFEGGSYSLYEAMFNVWGVGFNEVMKSIQSSIGAEYWYGNPKLIGLRGGFFYEDPNHGKRKFVTLGAGLRYSLYGFDFSYISTMEGNHPLDNTLRFTLSVNFGKPVSKTPTTPGENKEPKK